MSSSFDVGTISEKFEKELVTFMLWISDSDYKIRKTKESEELDWSIDLLSSFKEPGRNKLESFIKELKNMYFISYNDEEINDIKSITKNFRENKSKISKNMKGKKIKNVNNKTNSKSNDNTKDHIMNELDNSKSAAKLYKLDLTTEMLVKAFGMPKYCKNEYIKYKWNLKCEKSDKSFMIYNWVKEDGVTFDTFEDTEWYISCTSYIDFMDFFETQKNTGCLYESLDNVEVLNPRKNDKLEKQELQEEYKYVELKKEDDNYENLEIDLDDIEL